MDNFFYNLNDKLNSIREKPETTHKQLNERDMSRAAKGYEKYGKAGMQALAKAGREGKSLDPIRDKYNKYKDSVEEASGDYSAKKARAGQDIGKPGKNFEKIAKDAGQRYGSKAAGERVAGAVLNKLRHPKESQGMTDEGNEFSGELVKAKANHQDSFKVDGRTYPVKEAGVMDTVKKVGNKVLNKLGHGSDEDMRRDLQKKMGVPQTGKKPNFADRIAGAKKEVDEMLGDVAAEAIKSALSPKQKKIDMNKNGRLDANDFAMLRKGGNKQVADEGAGQFYVYHKTKGDRAGGADYDLLKTFPDKDSATSFAQKYNNKISADKKNFHSAVVRTKSVKKDMDEGWDEMEKDVKSRMGARRVGDVTHGDKHDTQEIPGGRRVTRRVDPNTGYSVGADSDEPAAGEKRGRGRPKSASGPRQERVTAKSRKTDRTAYSKKKTNEDDLDITDRGEYDQEGEMAKDDIKTIVRHAQALQKVLGDNDNLPEWVQAKLAKIEGMMTAVDDYMQNQEDDEEMAMGEEKTTKRDNRAERAGKKVTKDIEYDEKKKDGIHGAKRGAEDDKAEKAGKKVAKDIEYDEKKKKVKEAGGTDTPTASSGFGFGQGIYDSMNHELETMIRESMNISMNMNTDATGGPSKSVTVTATDDDALKLGELLKNAGLGGHDYPHIEGGADLDHPGAIEVNGTMDAEGAEALADQIRQAMGDHGHEHDDSEVCDACGQEDCGCETVDEAYGDDVVSQNSPDYPTNTETAQDSFEYSGGLNGPKSTGQTTIPVIAGQEERMGADDLHRLREMAGIREAKKPDFPDVDNDGNKKETIEKAVDDKKAAGDKKVAESLMAELQRFMKA